MTSGHHSPGSDHEPIYGAERVPASTGPRPWTLAWLWQEFIYTVLPAIIVAKLITTFVVQGTHIYGPSMEPALYEGDRVFVEKVSYRFRPPQRGDIVMLHLPQYRDFLIKRVVGLPGEEIAIHDGHVYINGHVLLEPYLTEPTPGEMPAMRIPALHYFVLGDNRDDSNDSRYFGPVPRDYIVGRLVLRFWPPERAGLVH